MGRLVIREIVLENFKSYGGRRVIGPFHECFSAIIGPNGSGKSNVIDALMFVFGKKAKKIRLSKLSELIHNPQKGVDRPSSARVEVVFHEIQDIHPGVYESVPDSELIVSRDVTQNNASKYSINGKSSSWTEVTALFSGKGIDLEHNRFLILQGEVEQIAMMKPMGDGQHEEGLLDYLEDLIGSNQFIAEIGEKSSNFAAFSETRNEHLHRVKQAEKEKDQLEGPRQEAEMYVKAATELLEAKSIFLMIQRYQNDLKIDSSRAEVTEIAAELDRVNELVEKETGEGRKIEVLYEEKKSQKDSLKVKLDSARTGFNTLDETDAGIRAKIKLTKGAIDKESKSIETEKKLVEKLTLDLSEMTGKLVPELEKNIFQIEEKLSTESAKLDVLFESVHSVTFALKGDKERKEVEQGEIRALVDELENEKKIIHAQCQVLVDKQKFAQDIRDKNERGIRKLESDLADRNAGYAEAQESGESIAIKLGEISTEILRKNREYELGLNAVSTAKQKMEAAKAHVETLAEGGRGGGALMNLHNKIRAEVDRGKLKGVLGRLGDLGDVEEKFQIAFNVALSAQMEALVVEKAADAQSVVEFVKKNNLGRITCIILDKVQPTPSPISTACPRMVDLIATPSGKPLEDRVRNAFFFAIRDTLVAEDIDQATAVGLGGEKRYRVVTLAGQLVDPSGAMTGGGTVSQLRKNSRQVIEAAEKEIDRETAKFEQLSAQFENLRNEKNQLMNQRDSLEKSLEQFKTVLANSEEIAQLEEQLQGEQTRIASLPVVKLSATEQNQVAEFEREIAICEHKLLPRRNELESVEAEIEKITNKIVAIAGEKTRQQKLIVDEISKSLDLKKKELSKAQVDKNKVDLRIAKAEKSITESREELSELEQRLVKESGELTEIELEAEKQLQDFNQCKVEQDRIAVELMDLEKILSTFKSKISELRKKNLLILNEIEKIEQIKKEFELKSKDFSKQINSVRKEWKALPHELVAFNDEELEERRKKGLEDENAEQIQALTRDLTRDELQCISPPEVQTTVIRLEAKMTKLHPNVKAIEEYREKLAEFTLKKRELDQVCEEREECRKKLEFLRQERLTMFMSGFNIISLKVKEMYQMLTLGGDAELELVDSTDPFAKGISFSVRPPKKTWKAITQLSGGEKTLSSLSLVFALHYFKPTPLYFLDEIDAALDSRNVAIISNYIKQRATDAQFIIISLRNQMFEIADWLVGIYKTEHISKSVTLDPAAASGAFQPNEQTPFYATPSRGAPLDIEEAPQRGS